VQVTIDSESLIAQGAAAPGWITSLTGQQITPVSARAVRRLACDSVRQLLLLDPRGHLDARSITSSFGNMVEAQLLTISSDSAAIITTRFTTAGGLCPAIRIFGSPSATG
jgi:hypothetical protein